MINNKIKYGKVAVLMGGTSSEREVSLRSGQAVLEALLRSGLNAHGFDPSKRPLHELAVENFDRVFIALHGKNGEDGTVQGALEAMGIPFTGSDVKACVITMDKWLTKLVWESNGLSTPKYRIITDASNETLQKIIDELGLPLMVKPSNEGSSIGISKVSNIEELKEAYYLAKKYDHHNGVFAEQFIDGLELTASIVNEDIFPLIKVETESNFYDYHSKYKSEETRYVCPCGLTSQQEDIIKALALEAFLAVGCKGWGRIDIMYDETKNQAYLLEVNTAPGMTDHSLVPMAGKAAGLTFDQLVLKILDTTLIEEDVDFRII